MRTCALVFELDVTDDWTPTALQAAVDSHTWFHSFEFSNGVRTPGRDPSAAKLSALQLPDLRGKSVLDIGAFDGYFSFQAERLGASRVVANDSVVWETEPESRERLRLVRDVLGSSVQDEFVPIGRVLRDRLGEFDVVLFLGVLYHAPNMLHYLSGVRAVTREVAIIETLVDLLDVSEPVARFYPSKSVNADASTYWGPNIACVEEMLLRIEFSRVEFKGLWHTNTLAELRGEPRDGPVTSGRGVWHAYV